MSFIQFESANEKEKVRQELREARAQLLEQAKCRAEQRAQREAKEELSGDKNWMLPSLSEKLEKKSKKHKRLKKKSKEKTEVKHKKRRKKDKGCDSDSDDSHSNASNLKRKSKKSKHKHKHQSRSSSESSESEDEWIERNQSGVLKTQVEEKCEPLILKQLDNKPLQHDSWMTESSCLDLKTFSRQRAEPKKLNEKIQQVEIYDPAKSKLELNPHWKTTGNGLPAFQKPKSHDEYSDGDERPHQSQNRRVSLKQSGSRNWQKKNSNTKTAVSTDVPVTSSCSESSDDSNEPSDSNANAKPRNLLTDQELNQLASKVIKAEMKGDKALANNLQQQLEEAREIRANHLKLHKTNNSNKSSHSTENVLLTVPLPTLSSNEKKEKNKTKKRNRVETHVEGERVCYFADDDRYSLKQMFEREKFTSSADSDLQFANIVSSQKNVNDDLEDIFADKVRKHISQADTEKKDLQRAIAVQTKMNKCECCLESEKVDKRLIVSMGSKIYMALPWHVGLQSGHCVLVPMQHAVCATQLDEDTWEELNNFRKSLTRMFATQRRGVVFYEIANKLHRQNHMVVHCIPVPDSQVEMVPFYFKKAIEESEQEWSVNKQLVSLRNKSLRAAIPKGLPYFWVNFGMDSGFAHVIEDQERFPIDFAQEILGGMLQLLPKTWRKPQKEQNVIQRTKVFANWWKDFDCSKQ